MRTGRRQKIAIDTRQATASLRSGTYLKMEGAAVDFGRNAVMGMYPTKNGRWSYLHCNFPNHRAAALKVLGVPEDREAVTKAVAQWDALELEEAIIAAKGAGGMVRTMEEWAQHPQGKAVASLPLMEIIKIGDSPPEAASRRATGRCRASACSTSRASSPGRPARARSPSTAPTVLKITAEHLPSLGRQEYDTGHGKLSARLDLREEKDREILRGLVRDADVFSQGYRPGTLGEPRFLSRGAGGDAAGHRRGLAVRLQSCRAVGIAPRLRHGDSDGERHHRTARVSSSPARSPARSSIRCRRSTS